MMLEHLLVVLVNYKILEILLMKNKNWCRSQCNDYSRSLICDICIMFKFHMIPSFALYTIAKGH